MSIDSKPSLPHKPRRTWRQWSKLARVRIGFVLMLIVAISVFSWWWPRRNMLVIEWGGGVVQEVQVNTAQLWSLPFLRLISTDSQVNWVFLGERQVDSAWLRRLQGLPRLERIGIPDAHLGPGLDQLAGHRSLLFVHIMPLKTESDLGELRRLPFLKSLVVCQPAPVGGGWKNLRDVHTLRFLDVDDVTSCGDLFKQIADVPQLEMFSITLERCDVGGDEVKPLSTLTRLKEFRISGTGSVEGCALKHLAQIQSLELLSLDNCSASNDELQVIAELPNLKSLRFGGPNTTPQGIDLLKLAMPNCIIDSP